ncbi:MAG TPA: MarR family transcriptional regulator [Anaerovoracaceae bacterium]|nr:MarR family transcriptional regulator [Anaerovoracaceae bacterium]
MSIELRQAASESLIRLRFLAAAHFMKPMRDREREKGEFPPGCMHVLGWLKSKGGPVSMTDLAASSFVSKPNLTTTVDRLCADGLVERSADINDRRVVNVALTPKGLDFLSRHKEEVAAFIESRLALLDDPDLVKLKRALDDMGDILSKIGERQKAIK